MINGTHIIIYSTDADADRTFLRDVLGFGHVDVGGGWLIFGLPPSEVAVHPAEANGTHEFYLMCPDISAFVTEMQGHGIACDPPQDQGWGVLTHLTLPGGGKLGVYEPRHARPEPMPVAGGTKRASAKRTVKAKGKGKVKAKAKGRARTTAAPKRGKKKGRR